MGASVRNQLFIVITYVVTVITVVCDQQISTSGCGNEGIDVVKSENEERKRRRQRKLIFKSHKFISYSVRHTLISTDVHNLFGDSFITHYLFTQHATNDNFTQPYFGERRYEMSKMANYYSNINTVCWLW